MYDSNLSIAEKKKVEWKKGGAASKRILFKKGRIGWLTTRVFRS